MNYLSFYSKRNIKGQFLNRKETRTYRKEKITIEKANILKNLRSLKSECRLKKNQKNSKVIVTTGNSERIIMSYKIGHQNVGEVNIKMYIFYNVFELEYLPF